MILLAETLGSLIDKLSIVKLKQYHTGDGNKLKSLQAHSERLINEVDAFILSAFSGALPVEEITFSANKVYKKEGNTIRDSLLSGDKGIGALAAELSGINCELWHTQEKVYDFESVLPENKNEVVKQLAVLNLERNICIDKIDNALKEAVINRFD